MIAAVLVVIVLVGAGHVYGIEKGGSCTFNVKTELDPKREPLVLSVKKTEIRGGLEDIEVESIELFRPNEKGIITVDNTKQIMFVCTGKKNYNLVTKTETAYATCKNGELTIEGKPVSIETDSCCRYADSWVRQTGTPCGCGDYTGEIFDAGFQMTDGTLFPLIEICHNITSTTTYYSAHALYGHSIKGAVKSSIRRKFTRGPSVLLPNVNPDKVYKKTGQEAAFKKILGTFSPYINSSSFLARGHLAPDADFIYNSGQLASYYYINAAPQWQAFNAGNWLAIENAVRYLASEYDATLNVFTGTHGTLILDEQEIYLDPDNKLIPAPQEYWKLVQHPVTKDCTVAVGVNNPFLTETPTTTICDPVSPPGWPTLTTLAKGYIYYCDFESFNKTCPYLPHLECKAVLGFPE